MKVKFLFLALIIALVSCNKDDDENNEPAGSTILKVGNTWVYEMNVSTSGITMTGEFTYEVMEKMDNGTYKVTLTTEITGMPSQTETEYWTEDDVFDIGKDLSSLKVGDTWDETEDGITYTSTVMAVNENVTVPAGTFACTKLKSTQSDDDTEGFSYFNVDYGMIKTEATITEEDEGVVYTVDMVLELKSKNF
jgi:hypothetical protein